MVQVTLEIEGMMCGMCESHMNDTVRKAVPDAKKVSSSHKKGTTVFQCETVPSEESLRTAIDATGYRLLSLKTEDAAAAKGRGLFGRKRA